jgi:cell division protein FtsB
VQKILLVALNAVLLATFFGCGYKEKQAAQQAQVQAQQAELQKQKREIEQLKRQQQQQY